MLDYVARKAQFNVLEIVIYHSHLYLMLILLTVIPNDSFKFKWCKIVEQTA